MTGGARDELADAGIRMVSVPGLRAGAPARPGRRGYVRAHPLGLRRLGDGSVRGKRAAPAPSRPAEHCRPGSPGGAAGLASRRRPGQGPVTGSTGRDRPARWLTASMVSLAVLAAASAVVSYAAQYRMVLAAKGIVPVAALEAAIPDLAALIFASLGTALALNGRRAIRARILNVAAVVTSVAMNVLASGHGWRDLAVWAMPPVAYALASDTAIGVVRAWTVARQKALDVALADDEATPLAIQGGLLL